MEILLRPFKAILLLPVVAGLLFGQASAPCQAISPDAAKKIFDVALVKAAEPPKPPSGLYTAANNPFATTGGPGTGDPGRFTAAHAALSNLIMRAYGIDLPDQDQFKGPAWLSNAAESGYAISATMPASTKQEEFCGMLRNLMTERFHLAFHYEKQPRPGYTLTVVPGGPKFKEFVPDPGAPGEGHGRGLDANGFPILHGSDANGFPILSQSQATAMVWNTSRTGVMKVSFRNTMAQFARMLAGAINQLNGTMGPGVPSARVVDKTGLAGIYDIRVERAGMPFPSAAPDGTLAPAASDPVDAGPNIFNAVQQQLGLKLTRVADVQVDVMIVDHIDRTPTEN